MSRWIIVLSLVFGCGLFGSLPAAAQQDTADASPLPTKALIREAIEKERFSDAETAYLRWSAYWQDDDAALLSALERGLLMNEFREGKNDALVALAQAGDREAVNVLTSQVLSNGNAWPPSELIPAIRFIGKSGDRNALNVLRAVLYSEDAAVVNATITALGDVGDPRIAAELMKLFDDADTERSILLARALVRLGQAKAVQARFEPQMKFPLPGVREKAALVLAAIGNPLGWPLLQNMLQTKDEAYYPLVVTVLGTLPTQESLAFVSAALQGDEAEQLAALQSITVLPADKIDATLLSLARNKDGRAGVRVQAIRLLAQRTPPAAAKELREMAIGAADDAAVKAEAMMALLPYGLLANPGLRQIVGQRVQSPEEPLSRAARAVLLAYALKKSF